MPDPLLQVRALDAHYGDFQALFGVSMRVDRGRGGGGDRRQRRRQIDAAQMHRRRDARCATTPSCFTACRSAAARRTRWCRAASRWCRRGGGCFPRSRVEENLLIGGQLGRKGPWNLKRVYELFPMLEERRNQPAPSLSGGQQQMVAIGRALMSNPRLLLCDEISLGLAPIVIRDIYARIPAIVAEGLSLVIVEQDIVQALKTARHVYCLQEGRVALQGERRREKSR